MPNGKLRKNQEIAVLNHPKMRHYHGRKEKVKLSQDELQLHAMFTNYYQLVFKRTEQRKQVKYKGEQQSAVIFDFVKIIRN